MLPELLYILKLSPEQSNYSSKQIPSANKINHEKMKINHEKNLYKVRFFYQESDSRPFVLYNRDHLPKRNLHFVLEFDKVFSFHVFEE